MLGLDLSKIPLEKLVNVYSRSLYTIDGLWFSILEQKYGFDAALGIDVEVWRQLGLIQAKRMLDKFAIKKDNSLQALVKALLIDPILPIYKPAVPVLNRHEAIFRCTDCPPQKARIRDGRGIFPCKPVGLAFFNSYAEVVDPGIKMTCLVCPPDDHPPEYWCEWQFEI